MDRVQHWDNVYATKRETEVSWYQPDPAMSISLIREFARATTSRIIDVGGGTSLLIDQLLASGYERPAVLDISSVAIERAKARLGERANRVDWIVGNICTSPQLGQFDLWHDRAMFHFLTDANDRARYTELAARTIRSNGHLILATFATDGPTRCSGLDVQRHGVESASAQLQPNFVLVKQTDEVHTTPHGKAQHFFYGVFKRLATTTSLAAEAPR